MLHCSIIKEPSKKYFPQSARADGVIPLLKIFPPAFAPIVATGRCNGAIEKKWSARCRFRQKSRKKGAA
jgi:hypothetical protein